MEELIIPVPPTVEVRRTAVVPLSDSDLCAVAKSASTAWTANPWLTLVWTSATEFADDANEFETVLDDRLLTGSTRPATTKQLEIINEKIDGALIYVKGYLSEKYGKVAAKSYYPAFGIKHKDKRYILPEDQNNRSAALTLMVSGITIHGFELKEYGTTFWTHIKEDYDTLLGVAVTTDGEVSDIVGDKNILKKKIKKTLNSIIHAIRGSYPDNYKQKLRLWGFQKEKY